MRFAQLVQPSLLSTNLKSSTKESVIEEIVQTIAKEKRLKNPKKITAKIIDRENQSSTGIGDGIALPHARMEDLKEVLFFVGISKTGIPFQSIDGKAVHVLFFFVTPLQETSTHLKILSRISQIISNKNLLNRIFNSKDNDELYQVLFTQRTQKESYISIPVKQVFEELGTNNAGLNDAEAANRLKEYGPNILKRAQRTSLLHKFLSNFTNLLAVLMWIGSALAFLIQMNTIGWAIICVIVINALFSFWQEFKAEKAIEALRNLIPYYTRVIRGGREKKIASNDVVPGDIIVLDEGDNIPADARLISAHELRVDNSVFSGESRPGYKTSELLESTEEYVWTEMPNMAFAGTNVVSGSGSAVIIATGMATEIGKIATLTQSVKEELSPLQKEINRLTRIIALVAMGLGLLFLFIGTNIAGLSIASSAIFALGIILGNVPEGLLPTVTLSLAVAVQRMSRRHVLIKKLSSVETLGSTNVICTDKTGTLTTNQISVKKIWLNNSIIQVNGSSYTPEGDFRNISEKDSIINDLFFKRKDFQTFMNIAALCSTASLIPPSVEKKFWTISGDPTEGALLTMAEKAHYSVAALRDSNPLIKRFPFESIRKRMSSVHNMSDGNRFAFVKGAPKELLALCSTVMIDSIPQPITEEYTNKIIRVIDSMAREGLRVLALACKQIPKEVDPAILNVDTVESDLTFVGISGMFDPPRPEVEGAISECREAGIRVVMITGDYEVTAMTIGRQVGIITSNNAKVITGTMLASISDEQLEKELSFEVVFARVNPEHKYRIVNAFKNLGNVVAVTGDGVNDAPALKKADIGIAMGIRGSDVAKEAADMILSDDNFSSIVAGIEEGRAVFDNIRKFVTYIFAHLVPEVVPFGIYAIFKTPVPITPLQILAIDLGTETLPALALGTEKPEKNIMKIPPYKKKRSLIEWRVLLRGYAYLGLLNAAFVMIAYFWVLLRGGWHPGVQLETKDTNFLNPLHIEAATIVFAGIIILQIANLLTCRSETRTVFQVGFFSNKLIFWGIAFSLVFLAAIIYIPFLQKIFNTTALGPIEWLVLFLFSGIIFAIEELRKLIWQKVWHFEHKAGKMHLKPV